MTHHDDPARVAPPGYHYGDAQEPAEWQDKEAHRDALNTLLDADKHGVEYVLDAISCLDDERMEKLVALVQTAACGAVSNHRLIGELIVSVVVESVTGCADYEKAYDKALKSIMGEEDEL